MWKYLINIKWINWTNTKLAKERPINRLDQSPANGMPAERCANHLRRRRRRRRRRPCPRRVPDASTFVRLPCRRGETQINEPVQLNGSGGSSHYIDAIGRNGSRNLVKVPPYKLQSLLQLENKRLASTNKLPVVMWLVLWIFFPPERTHTHTH